MAQKKNVVSACGRCKIVKKKCGVQCPYAALFPPSDAWKYFVLHAVFGGSEFKRRLEENPVDQRHQAVQNLFTAAERQFRDKKYCDYHRHYLELRCQAFQGLPPGVESSRLISTAAAEKEMESCGKVDLIKDAAAAAVDQKEPKRETFLFTSVSVSEGHPDKLCDLISDAIVDACLAQDPGSKVFCEACIKTGMVMVFGKIKSKAILDFDHIVRTTCHSVGFSSNDLELNAHSCKVLVNIEQQRPEIKRGVEQTEEINEPFHGQIFGYATDETAELMPLSHVLATKISLCLSQLCKNGSEPWLRLRPDLKTHVTMEYYNENGAMVPVRVHTVGFSMPADRALIDDKFCRLLWEKVVRPVIPGQYCSEEVDLGFYPPGQFIGLTGRKIHVDTYGGWGAHGSGAFSGKDPSNIDRSGAYIARQVAKSIVAAKLARRCIVQVSYATEPISVFVDTYGTGSIPDGEILKIVKKEFNFQPEMIPPDLDLKRSGGNRHLKTASYGHFGRDDPDFTWEVTKTLNKSN